MTSTIGILTVGAVGYGRSDGLSVSNCGITTLNIGGVIEKGPADVGVNLAAGWSMASGIISIPNAYGPARFAVPDTWFKWVGEFANETVAHVLDVTQDATHTRVHTNLGGGFPSVPLLDGKLYIRVVPPPDISFVNVTGVATQGARFGEYSLQTRTKADSAAPFFTGNEGNLTSLTVAVGTAYAGVTNPLTLTMTLVVLGPAPTYTKTVYQAAIDLRAPGTRTFTNASVAGSVGFDSFAALPSAVSNWVSSVQFAFSTDITAQTTALSFVIEAATDQGITGSVSKAANFG